MKYSVSAKTSEILVGSDQHKCAKKACCSLLPNGSEERLLSACRSKLFHLPQYIMQISTQRERSLLPEDFSR